MVNGALDSASQLAKNKNIRLEINNPANLPDFKGDHGRLVQTMIHLLSKRGEVLRSGIRNYYSKWTLEQRFYVDQCKG